MRYFFFAFFFLTIIPCFGQNADSLQKIVFSNAPAPQRLVAAAALAHHLSDAKPDQTFAVANAGIRLAIKLKKDKPLALLFKDVAQAWLRMGKPDSATYYCDKASTVLNCITPKNNLAGDYIELADLYNKLKFYNKAVGVYDTVIAYLPKDGSRQGLMLALNKTGDLYERLGKYRQSLDYYRQAYAISDSLDFVKKTKENTPETYSRKFMGDVMGSINQNPASVEGVLKAIEKRKALNDTLALAINYFNLGVLYRGQRNYPLALDALKHCMLYADKINYIDMEASAANEIADLYEQTGDFKQALTYLKRQQHLNTPEVRKHAKTVEELQTRYEITQREDQVLHQQLEIIKRNYWVAGAVVVLLLMLVIGFIYYNQTRLKERNIAMQAIIDTEESERNRIAQDLHDSVSQTITAAKLNLTSLGRDLPFISEEQRKRFNKAVSLVDDGFREVRTISHNMMPWALHKTGLAQVVKHFIENIGTETLSINLFSRGFDEPFNERTEIVLYRLLQESVNNVLKHAAASRVDISLIRDAESISLTIEDNGKGFDTTKPEVYRGMGLNNLQSRVNFLNGKFELSSQQGQGTLVSIYIPLTKKGL